MEANMAVFHPGILLVVSLVYCVPIENPSEKPHPICKYPTLWWDQTGFVCNEDSTGYYYCHYNGELQREARCPSGTRCACGTRCYVDDASEDIPVTRESEVCVKTSPPWRSLPDPAWFTYRQEEKSEWEQYEGPNYTIEKKWSGVVRQDIKNGKYMKINDENSDFHMILGHKSYTGNLKQETCKVTKTSESAPYWKLEKFLGGYQFDRESTKGGETVQTWIKPGDTRYDASEYFWVSVKDGYTLLGRYSVSRSRDWEDESLLVSSSRDIYYNTTYGVDSSKWFDKPHFCK